MRYYIPQNEVSSPLVPSLPACNVSTPATRDTVPAYEQPLDDASFNRQMSLDRWENDDVKLLISSWKTHEKLIGGKSTKKEIFQKIAKSFNEKSIRKVSGDQCLRKWQKLSSKFKEIDDHNNKTGRDNKTWKFYDEMKDCLHGSFTVSPPFTLESSVCYENESSETNDSSGPQQCSDSDEDENEQQKPQKNIQRKRKAPRKSSAAEMLDFLKDFSEKREKVEEEKVVLLKEMKEEKKAFFDRFFNMMEKK